MGPDLSEDHDVIQGTMNAVRHRDAEPLHQVTLHGSSKLRGRRRDEAFSAGGASDRRCAPVCSSGAEGTGAGPGAACR